MAEPPPIGIFSITDDRGFTAGSIRTIEGAERCLAEHLSVVRTLDRLIRHNPERFEIRLDRGGVAYELSWMMGLYGIGVFTICSLLGEENVILQTDAGLDEERLPCVLATAQTLRDVPAQTYEKALRYARFARAVALTLGGHDGILKTQDAMRMALETWRIEQAFVVAWWWPGRVGGSIEAEALL